MTALSDLLWKNGSNNLILSGAKKTKLNNLESFRSNYVFNSTIESITNADAILLVGCNPRHEAPIINIRIRKAFLNGADIGIVGVAYSDLNFEFDNIGTGVEDITRFDHPFIKKLAAAKNPMIIVGSGVFLDDLGSGIMGSVQRLCKSIPNLVKEGWNGFNVLQDVYLFNSSLLDLLLQWILDTRQRKTLKSRLNLFIY